jgi:hypothetical protein
MYDLAMSYFVVSFRSIANGAAALSGSEAFRGHAISRRVQRGLS